MQPYQDRVLNEKAELDQRLGKLQVFLNSSNFSDVAPEEQERLRKQAGIMEEYSAILAERIVHFS